MGLITQYSATLYTGGSESNLQCKAIINCYNDTQLPPVMTAHFYYEGYFIPPNSKHIDKVTLRYSIAEYDHFLDLLRNEKSVFFCFNEHSKIGYIRTGQEPVTEPSTQKSEIEEFVG
jgi:hypothetical protein